MALEAVKDSGHQLHKCHEDLETWARTIHRASKIVDIWHLQCMFRPHHSYSNRVKTVMPMKTQHYLERIMACVCLNSAQQHGYPVASTFFIDSP